MSVERIPVTITVQPWFKDHFFGGKVVFPAVETMLLLSARALAAHPEIDIRIMENVRFAKFLELPKGSSSVPALVECSGGTDGRVQAKLLSRIQFKVLSRLKEHGEIFFPLVKENNWPHLKIIDSAPLAGRLTEVNVERLYRELVPFGPNYHTLQDTLYLSDKGAWGKLQAPMHPLGDPVQDIIGSPFPLDGALHAACVLGQQSVDFIPFPVGFDRRIISRPTQPGDCYVTKVVPVSRTNDELIFDLAIFDNYGQIYETVTGVRMRNVSGAMSN
jgi:hypothetical protein